MEETGCIVVAVSACGREALIDCGDGRLARLFGRQARFVRRHDAVRGRLTCGARRRLYNASRDWWFDCRIEAAQAEPAMA